MQYCYPSRMFMGYRCISIQEVVLINHKMHFIFYSLSGTAAYDKLKTLLANKILLGDIKKLSPDAQTSCLEDFHPTLNHWHPKMIGFSWLGTFCRYDVCTVVKWDIICTSSKVIQALVLTVNHTVQKRYRCSYMCKISDNKIAIHFLSLLM